MLYFEIQTRSLGAALQVEHIASSIVMIDGENGTVLIIFAALECGTMGDQYEFTE